MVPQNKYLSGINNRKRVRRAQVTATTLIWAAAILTLGILLIIVGYILINGIPNITLEFLTSPPKGLGNQGGILPMIVNTLYLVFLSLLFSAPLSILAAIYLTEYAKAGRLVRVINFAVENLAGIPSIIFGLFGFTLFGRLFGFGWSLLSGSLTAAVVIMPTLVRTAQDAIASVPVSYREGSLALGATKLQTIMKVVLPSAMPGILSGIILSMGRIVGETAALFLTLGSGTRIATSLLDSARSLALHLYTLIHEGISVPKAFATATVLILLIVLLNFLASFLVKRLNRSKRI
ncbi:MAG: phosphate ABC transporter permease PstA [Bacillota bacterium]